MTQHQKDLKAIRDAIISAENSLRTAKHLLSSVLGESTNEKIEFEADGDKYLDGNTIIVEGVFTGENMLGGDGNTYPVPQNYASKSLLVQGSKLKAIILPNGKINYKIIQEIEYENASGIVTKVGEKYQIITSKKTYNVLVAAITFHKCSVGDTVNIRIPKGKEATYAVIENIIPKN